jgi:hypothetical protein
MAFKTASRKIVPFRVSTPRPIIVRQTKIVKSKRKGHHRHHHHKAGLGGFASAERIGIGIGAYALGYVQKQNWNIPALPVIGKTGTIALIAHFISDGGKNKLAADIATAALAVAGFTLATTGAIVGGEEEPSVVGGW